MNNENSNNNYLTYGLLLIYVLSVIFLGVFYAIPVFIVIFSRELNKAFQAPQAMNEPIVPAEIIEYKECVTHFIPAREKAIRTAISSLLTKLTGSGAVDIEKKVNDFLNDKKPLAFRQLNRSQVVFDILTHICNPSKVDQQRTNTCGIAVFISALSHQAPTHLLNLALTLAKNGKTQTPLKLIAPTALLQGYNSIIFALICAIRHSTNLTGYSPNSFFERYRALTRPKCLVQLLEQTGFNEISDFTEIPFDQNKFISRNHNWLIGSLYSPCHQHFENKLESIEIIEKNLSEGKICLLLIGNQLTRLIINDNDLPLEKSTYNAVGLKKTHYVYLKKLSYSQENITLTIETYGDSFTKEIPLQQFLQDYHGAICARFSLKDNSHTPDDFSPEPHLQAETLLRLT